MWCHRCVLHFCFGHMLDGIRHVLPAPSKKCVCETGHQNRSPYAEATSSTLGFAHGMDGKTKRSRRMGFRLWPSYLQGKGLPIAQRQCASPDSSALSDERNELASLRCGPKGTQNECPVCGLLPQVFARIPRSKPRRCSGGRFPAPARDTPGSSALRTRSRSQTTMYRSGEHASVSVSSCQLWTDGEVIRVKTCQTHFFDKPPAPVMREHTSTG